MARRKGFDAVLLELYSAALEPDHFRAALRAANAHFGAVTTGIDGMRFDEETFRPTGFRFDSDLDPGMVEAYTAYCSEHLNPRTEYAMRHLQAGEIGSDLDVMDLQALQRHPFYQTVLQPFRSEFALFGAARITPSSALGLTVHFERPQPLRDRALVREVRLFNRHLALVDRIASLAAAALPDEDVVSHARGVLLLDGNGRLLWSDLLGEHFAESAGIVLEHSAAPCALQAPLKHWLDCAIARAAAWSRDPDGRTSAAAERRLPDGTRLSLTPVRYPRSDWPTAAVRIVLIRPKRRTTLAERLAARGLTPTERALCYHMLGDGASVQSFAEVRGCAVETARLHMKRTLAKLGLHSQLDLVRMLLRDQASLT